MINHSMMGSHPADALARRAIKDWEHFRDTYLATGDGPPLYEPLPIDTATIMMLRKDSRNMRLYFFDNEGN